MISVMVGKQIVNNLLEFFNATRRTLTRKCFERDEPEAQEQWEKDNKLYDFRSDTLIDEYLEIGKRYSFNLYLLRYINIILFLSFFYSYSIWFYNIICRCFSVCKNDLFTFKFV